MLGATAHIRVEDLEDADTLRLVTSRVPVDDRDARAALSQVDCDGEAAHSQPGHEHAEVRER